MWIFAMQENFPFGVMFVERGTLLLYTMFVVLFSECKIYIEIWLGSYNKGF